LLIGVVFVALTISIGVRWLRAVWRRRDPPA
jgi:hypothetical protein